MITAQILNKITPALKGQLAVNIANAINKVFPLYGMLQKNILIATLPNLIHECSEFTRFEENLNYSVDGLIKGFGRHRITINQAQSFGRLPVRPANKKAIANTIYGGEWGKKNLGNTLPNDGWDLRGSGAIQATGRAVMAGFAHYHNTRFGTSYNVLQMSDELRKPWNLELNMHFVCWFLSIFKKLLPKVGNFEAFVIGINGGLKGWEDRDRYYQRAKVAI